MKLNTRLSVNQLNMIYLCIGMGPGMQELLNVYLQLKIVLFERTEHIAEPEVVLCIIGYYQYV